METCALIRGLSVAGACSWTRACLGLDNPENKNHQLLSSDLRGYAEGHPGEHADQDPRSLSGETADRCESVMGHMALRGGDHM